MGGKPGNHPLAPPELSWQQAFAQGARALYDEAYPHLPPSHALELSEWLDGLEKWTAGSMPLRPSDWPYDEAELCE